MKRRRVLKASALAAMIPLAALAGETPIDTRSRAAFCMGAIDRGIAMLSEPIPPMYITSEGKEYTPPAVARANQEYTAKAIRELSYRRERVRKFLLPLLIGGDALPLAVAMKEGDRLF
jgi:hypothetical protein